MSSTRAAEHHRRAAEHHEQAARHHLEAAKRQESGDHMGAAHHAQVAHGHHLQAQDHAEEAALAHTDEHGESSDVPPRRTGPWSFPFSFQRRPATSPPPA
jgi:hypothetical protein